MSGVAEDSHLQSNKKLPVVRGELALVIVILINSLGVVLMLYSGSGISAISSVPYAFSEVFPHVTLGTWTYIFQGLLILSLMIMRKKFVVPYLFSFIVGFVFSEMLDLYESEINILPTAMGFRVLYFVISYLLTLILEYLNFVISESSLGNRSVGMIGRPHRLERAIPKQIRR